MTKKASVEIINIKEQSYLFNKIDQKIIDNFDVDRLYLKLGITFSKKINENTVNVSPNVVYSYVLEDNTEISLLDITYAITYQIVLEEDDFEKSEKVILPEEIMEVIVSVAFDTLRGVIAVKTAGTYLTNYPLHLLDKKLLINSLDKHNRTKTKSSTKKSPSKKTATKRKTTIKKK